MSDTVYTCGGVELREVDGNAVEWVAAAPNGPFKQVDARNYMIATNDLMSHYYMTMPKGLPDAKYEHLNAVLTALKDGQAIPAAPGASAPAVPHPAPAPAASGSAAPAFNPMGDLLKAVADKAAHDTLLLGQMIKQKAEHDMKQFQDNQGQQKP
eukprot:gene3278-3555_t